MLALLIATSLSFAQADPTVPLQPAPATQTAESLETAPPTDPTMDPLLPAPVDVVAITPATTEEQRAAFAGLSEELKKSISRAQGIADKARDAVKTDGQRIKLAKAELKARKLDVSAAKKELKVQALADSGAGEREAEAAVEAAKGRQSDAEAALKLQGYVLAYDKARYSHARQVVALEEAKLAEAEARAQSPAVEEGDLLKLQKSRAKAEGNEAKARADVASEQARLVKAQGH